MRPGFSFSSPPPVPFTFMASHINGRVNPPPRPGDEHDVPCDECGMTPIRGTRYRCLVCDAYNLCAACEYHMGSGVPPHDITHRFAKLCRRLDTHECRPAAPDGPSFLPPGVSQGFSFGGGGKPTRDTFKWMPDELATIGKRHDAVRQRTGTKRWEPLPAVPKDETTDVEPSYTMAPTLSFTGFDFGVTPDDDNNT